jgi:hypothetical protein
MSIMTPFGKQFPRLTGVMILCACVASGCQTVDPFDYSRYHQYPPRSILVLPPIDNTAEVEASYAYLPTVTRPIVERGYYVFPVAVVVRMMRENGLPGPAEMHTVSLAKIDEIFGADAVLYLILSEWGTSYTVIDSSTRVTVHGRLVDVETGTELWSGEATAAESSSTDADNVEEMLLGAILNQVLASTLDPSQSLARQANQSLFNSVDQGLLPGPYHPDFESP